MRADWSAHVLKSFWRKNALLNFLRRHKIAEGFLATWQETETKRVFVGRLFPKLESDNKGAQVIKQMAVSLSEQLKFPDLEGWEDTQAKVQSAKEAIVALRRYLNAQEQKADDAKTREETKKPLNRECKRRLKSAKLWKPFLRN